MSKKVAAIKYYNFRCQIIYCNTCLFASSKQYTDQAISQYLLYFRKTFNPNRDNINGYVVFKDEESVGKALIR